MRNLTNDKDNIQFWNGQLNKEFLEDLFSEFEFKSLQKNNYIEKFAILL